jgi:hypothetical protein
VHELLLLQLLRGEGGREQAAEVVRVALRLREGQALVVPRVAEQGVPAVQSSPEEETVWLVVVFLRNAWLVVSRNQKQLFYKVKKGETEVLEVNKTRNRRRFLPGSEFWKSSAELDRFCHRNQPGPKNPME